MKGWPVTIQFLLISLLFVPFGCKQPEAESGVDEAYRERYRPQFHFSPPSMWMNDPNGMFFLDGEYHLFYQHYPEENVWGPMHWGHAVSEDLVHWENLPIAIYPDSLGYIFSGSAVVDHNNTSGLGTEENPPIVAVYTYHNPDLVNDGAIDFQYQGIAYSNDKGRSWTKYEGNPVLPNPGIRDFRDPKVMWYEAGQKWIMTLAVFNRVSFYSSPDLINWTYESDFGIDKGSHAGVWECPDLVQMKVEGSEEVKWVLLLSINPGGPQGGSATQYFVGEFDGNQFILDPEFEKELVVNKAIFPPGEVFDDFEHDLNGWTITGEAFGGEPATDTMNGHEEVTGYSGKGMLSSLHGGDGSTGSMESREFVIDKPYINLKVGGGNDQTATYVALWIEGKEVSRVTGKNGDNLLVRSWDVSNYIGKTARLQVVDQHSGGWGHVLVDDIVFSDQRAIPMSEEAIWIDYGADNYAGVTWSNTPDQRTIFLGWMSNWQYAQVVPTTEWRSAMTLPRSITLHRFGDSYRLHSSPVNEVEKLIGSGSPIPETLPDSTYVIDLEVSGEFDLTFSNAEGEELRLGLQGELFYVDRQNAGISEFSTAFPAVHNMPVKGIEMRTVQVFMDASSVEVFLNGGEAVMTELVFPNEPYNKVSFSGAIDRSFYRSVSSIW